MRVSGGRDVGTRSATFPTRRRGSRSLRDERPPPTRLDLSSPLRRMTLAPGGGERGGATGQPIECGPCSLGHPLPGPLALPPALASPGLLALTPPGPLAVAPAFLLAVAPLLPPRR